MIEIRTGSAELLDVIRPLREAPFKLPGISRLTWQIWKN